MPNEKKANDQSAHYCIIYLIRILMLVIFYLGTYKGTVICKAEELIPNVTFAQKTLYTGYIYNL